MRSAFANVVSAVIASLQAQPPVCKNIYRARAMAVPDQDDVAISVQWEQSVPAGGTINGAPIDWTTRLTVECYARGTSDESGDLAVDPLLKAVFERLAANSTLDGVVTDLQVIGVEAENTTDGKKNGWVRLTYTADHRTSNFTLS
jgi:hypothetical protein